MAAAGVRPANRLEGWAESLRLHEHENKVLLVLTLIIGALVGLVVVAFILLTENLGARLYPAGEGAAWRRLLIPVVGSLGTGFLLFRYFPNARGSGIPQAKIALFLRDGYISLRTVAGKFSLCSISLASGIALGREGPSVQVGAGLASVLGRRPVFGRRRGSALAALQCVQSGRQPMKWTLVFLFALSATVAWPHRGAIGGSEGCGRVARLPIDFAGGLAGTAAWSAGGRSPGLVFEPVAPKCRDCEPQKSA